MKASKTKKKVLSESKPNSSIQDYFKVAGKDCADNKISDVKTAYVQALKDRIKSFDNEEIENSANKNSARKCNDTSHTAVMEENSESNARNDNLLREPTTSTAVGVNETKSIECQQCEVWRQKYEELRKTYVKLCVKHTDQSMKHDDLLKATESSVRASSDEVTSGEASESSSPSDDGFTEREIRHLQSLPLHKKKDSTFILQCIEYAYQNRTAELTNRTLKGTRDRYEVQDGVPTVIRPGKEPLTPEKVQKIEKLFIARISKSKCLAGEFGERIAPTYINRLIASAIKNVSNKEKPPATKSAENQDLPL